MASVRLLKSDNLIKCSVWDHHGVDLTGSFRRQLYGHIIRRLAIDQSTEIFQECGSPSPRSRALGPEHPLTTEARLIGYHSDLMIMLGVTILSARALLCKIFRDYPEMTFGVHMLVTSLFSTLSSLHRMVAHSVVGSSRESL